VTWDLNPAALVSRSAVRLALNAHHLQKHCPIVYCAVTVERSAVVGISLHPSLEWARNAFIPPSTHTLNTRTLQNQLQRHVTKKPDQDHFSFLYSDFNDYHRPRYRARCNWTTVTVTDICICICMITCLYNYN
jgi:hypothetical protein